MPRHEIIVERVPKVFQGKPVSLNRSTRTVAEYLSRGGQQFHCLFCDEKIDASSLIRVLETWEPHAVISFQSEWKRLPGESWESQYQTSNEVPRREAGREDVLRRAEPGEIGDDA